MRHIRASFTGTWGIAYKVVGTNWVRLGYTLEVSINSPKGPIPLGDYKYHRQISDRLGKSLRLENVPGYTDILVHRGTHEWNTQGCILIGSAVDHFEAPTELKDSIAESLYDGFQFGHIGVHENYNGSLREGLLDERFKPSEYKTNFKN
jgi:hypothetical protein